MIGAVRALTFRRRPLDRFTPSMVDDVALRGDEISPLHEVVSIVRRTAHLWLVVELDCGHRVIVAPPVPFEVGCRPCWLDELRLKAGR